MIELNNNKNVDRKQTYTVTQKVKKTKQPRGGYVNISMFVKKELENPIIKLENMILENYSPPIIGICVDYLTRFMFSKNVHESFRISHYGASNLNMEDKYFQYTKNVKDLSEESIYCALKLSEFDVAYRANPIFYKSNSEKPNMVTINHIKAMVENSLKFFEDYGPITKYGFNFIESKENDGYSKIVTNGDGDFLTNDTLWDFKVSKNSPTKNDSLQLIMYFLMGKKSNIDHFKNIKNIGIYNPRLNTIYICNVSDLDKSILEEVALNVIEYDDTSFIDNII